MELDNGIDRRRRQRLLVVLAFVAFVSLGLPDGVLGVAWPSIRSTFGRQLGELGALLGAGMVGYLTASFLGGQIVRGVGIGWVLVGSCALVTAALVGNALAPAWWLMVAIAGVGGLGAGAIDAGLNAYAATRFSPRVLNWLHACWGIGATTGPLLMTGVLRVGWSWRIGYGVLAVALTALTGLFAWSRGMWEKNADGGRSKEEREVAPVGEAIARPVVWMQVLLFLIYGGIEATAGHLLYSLFTESRGMDKTVAGVTVGGYWAALTAGRIVFGQAATALTKTTVLRIGTVLAPLAAGLIAWHPAEWVGIAGAVLLGFALAPIFPTLISVTSERVGERLAAHAVGFQVAATSVGIALFPGLVGGMARRVGLEGVGAYLVAAAVLLLVMQEYVGRMKAVS